MTKLHKLLKKELKQLYKRGKKGWNRKLSVNSSLAAIAILLGDFMDTEIKKDKKGKKDGRPRREAPWGAANANHLSPEEAARIQRSSWGDPDKEAREDESLGDKFLRRADEMDGQADKAKGKPVVGMATVETLNGPPIRLTQEGRCALECRAERMEKGLPPVWEGTRKYRRGIACGKCDKVFRREEIAAVVPEIPGQCSHPNADELVKAEIKDCVGEQLDKDYGTDQADEQAALVFGDTADDAVVEELPNAIYPEERAQQIHEDFVEAAEDMNSRIFEAVQTFSEESGSGINTIKSLDLSEANLVRWATESTDPHRKKLGLAVLHILSGGAWTPPPPKRENDAGETLVYCAVEGCGRRAPLRHLNTGAPIQLQTPPCKGKVACMFGVAQSELDKARESSNAGDPSGWETPTDEREELYDEDLPVIP